MFGRDRRAINVPPAAEKAAEKQLLQLWDRLDSTSRLRAIEYLTQLTELQDHNRAVLEAVVLSPVLGRLHSARTAVVWEEFPFDDSQVGARAHRTVTVDALEH